MGAKMIKLSLVNVSYNKTLGEFLIFCETEDLVILILSNQKELAPCGGRICLTWWGIQYQVLEDPAPGQTLTEFSSNL